MRLDVTIRKLTDVLVAMFALGMDMSEALYQRMRLPARVLYMTMFQFAPAAFA
ncbi:hypothetical protein PC116_g21450 [Phytophthora cactorum]|uniref:Uncharacterized protein n=1 Tax=Phytophthora cactorum TaxID=29920 RepID=A0A8T1BZV0_9STRA|nr:hypothetical protein PC114_g18946 [Phytophthora cactorum]KAG2914143.1 hypothetical protein PC117_g18418 [Phytophthora cactorum]KAG2994126.1 hypothetical protein PC119_g18334 [Phytophthora cactorum]KAG4230247.1 hypothetical protein PC116_g21450 [Phytophthora cactorum]